MELYYGEHYKYEEVIGLINNAIIYLFDRVSYKLSERKIEGYSYPGVSSTMKSLLTYSSECNIVEVNLSGGLINVNQ